MELTRNDILQFFAERPILFPSQIGRAAGVGSAAMYRIMRGDYDLTQRTAEKLLPILLLYGWNSPHYAPFAKIERKKFRKIIFPGKVKKTYKVRYVVE